MITIGHELIHIYHCLARIDRAHIPFEFPEMDNSSWSNPEELCTIDKPSNVLNGKKFDTSENWLRSENNLLNRKTHQGISLQAAAENPINSRAIMIASGARIKELTPGKRQNNVNYSKANLNEIVIYDKSFGNCRFMHTIMMRCTIQNTRFVLTNFTATIMLNSLVENVLFVQCTFFNTDFRGVRLKNATFKNCKFSNILIDENLQQTELAKFSNSSKTALTLQPNVPEFIVSLDEPEKAEPMSPRPPTVKQSSRGIFSRKNKTAPKI